MRFLVLLGGNLEVVNGAVITNLDSQFVGAGPGGQRQADDRLPVAGGTDDHDAMIIIISDRMFR
ncbi:MAG: hypothetical protein HW386_1653, partial [Gammaproteobacteria bacterium]|nr:hypothetical protein [Gammaproteobacteria bacterium]